MGKAKWGKGLGAAAMRVLLAMPGTERGGAEVEANLHR